MHLRKPARIPIINEVSTYVVNNGIICLIAIIVKDYFNE